MYELHSRYGTKRMTFGGYEMRMEGTDPAVVWVHWYFYNHLMRGQVFTPASYSYTREADFSGLGSWLKTRLTMFPVHRKFIYTIISTLTLTSCHGLFGRDAGFSQALLNLQPFNNIIDYARDSTLVACEMVTNDSSACESFVYVVFHA